MTRESIPLPPDLTPAAEQLVDAIDLDGYSEIEFRRDSEGRAALMEINPRLSASVEIAVRSGVNFPLLLFSWAAGTPLRPALDYRTGTRMRWLGGDIRWMSETLKSQGRPDVEPALLAVWHFLFDFFRPGAYDYLAWDDLLPAFVASAAMLRKIGHSRGSRPRRPGPTRSAS